MARISFVTGLKLRRTDIITSPPQFQLIRSELGFHIDLVEALQRTVVPFVKRQQLCTGIHILSKSSRTIQSVRIARFRTEVYAISKSKPLSRRIRPASFACWRPFAVRSTSVQSVKRLSPFHSLSPCLRSMSVCI